MNLGGHRRAKLAIATENFRGRFNWAFGIGSEGFAAGTPTPAAEPAPA